MTDKPHFPGAEWETKPAEELGFDPVKLEKARTRLAEYVGSEGRYGVVVVRGGYIAAEWYAGVEEDRRNGIASTRKSFTSCLLGIAVAEGKIPSVDARASEFYPEMLEIPEGCGPKPNRCNKPEDAQITFRHLITNTSGYLKPGELPGKVFHYQSFGMNVVEHALARLYGVYRPDAPESLPGVGEPIREELRYPIGASWTYSYGNFEHAPGAKMGVWGYKLRLNMTCRDMARAGWLWRNWGNWNGQQVVPADYLRQATVTAPHIVENIPEEHWCYGHAFWTNDYGKLWPSLPRDSFAAAGAGSHHIWVCPGLDLVIVQRFGPWEDQAENDGVVIPWILDAIR